MINLAEYLKTLEPWQVGDLVTFGGYDNTLAIDEVDYFIMKIMEKL
jgi:hypothetical protein